MVAHGSLRGYDRRLPTASSSQPGSSVLTIVANLGAFRRSQSSKDRQTEKKAGKDKLDTNGCEQESSSERVECGKCKGERVEIIEFVRRLSVTHYISSVFLCIFLFFTIVISNHFYK